VDENVGGVGPYHLQAGANRRRTAHPTGDNRRYVVERDLTGEVGRHDNHHGLTNGS
jgi:hypothetical protein